MFHMKNNPSALFKKIKNLSFIALLFLMANCADQKPALPETNVVSLKESFADNFLIGAAVNDALISLKDSLGANLIKRNTIPLRQKIQ